MNVTLDYSMCLLSVFSSAPSVIENAGNTDSSKIDSKGGGANASCFCLWLMEQTFACIYFVSHLEINARITQ